MSEWVIDGVNSRQGRILKVVGFAHDGMNEYHDRKNMNTNSFYYLLSSLMQVVILGQRPQVPNSRFLR